VGRRESRSSRASARCSQRGWGALRRWQREGGGSGERGAGSGPLTVSTSVPSCSAIMLRTSESTAALSCTIWGESRVRSALWQRGWCLDQSMAGGRRGA
jgi:hypothetical protein